MNRQCHRLVFSRRHGMLVAVADHARVSGKAGSGASRRRSAVASAASLALVTGLLASAPGSTLAQAATRAPVVFASQRGAPAAVLPQPYTNSAGRTFRPFAYNPAQGAGSTDLAAGGKVTWSLSADGKLATFDQGSQARVVLNWDSFDIAAGYRVHFKQDTDPTRYVSALNRIWSADPSLIFGSLTADREVILVNGNGVYFGRGARVDTGRLIASTLNIADSVFEKGLRNITDGSAVFDGTDPDMVTGLDSAVSVEAGAEIRSAAGGDVLLLAPRVVNQGRIVTPHGQTVLAAGEKVYLMSSSDPAQRGLIVAVDPFKVEGVADATLGSVVNAATGSYKTLDGVTVADGTPDGTAGLVSKLNEIRAESGTVNLVGLAVRQAGVINATTAVKGANGAIYLQAMASTTTLAAGAASAAGSAGDRGLTIESGSTVRVGQRLGTVELAAGSLTAVTPDTGTATQLDAETFNASRIRVEGAQISVAGGAQVLAPAGKIELLAATDTLGNGTGAATFNSLFYGSTASLLTSAGADDGSRLVVAPDARISAAGLRDVAVDGSRNQGALRLFRIELADAPVQRSGPLYRQQVYFDLRDGSSITAADVSGAASAVNRSASELSTQGGSVSLGAQGTVLLGAGSQVDVSGGSVRHGATVLASSLVERAGRVMAFSTLGAGTSIDSLLPLTQRVVTPAYTEGQAGGQLSITGQRVAMADAGLRGSVVLGERQRTGTDAAATPALLSVRRGAASGAESEIALLATSPAAAEVPASVFEAPLSASLQGLGSVTELALDQVSAGGFGRLSLAAPRLAQTEFGSLDLGVGGALTLRTEQALRIDGNFAAAGGSFQLASSLGRVSLSGRSTLNTAGLWTNDLSGAAINAAAQAVQTAGGSIALSGFDGVRVDAGATLDVSAGAWRTASGSLSTGQAGNISLTNLLALGSETGRTDLDGVALRAFGFSSGGTLSLSALDLRIGDAPGTHPTLSPALFSAHGFGQIHLATTGFLTDNGGDVTVASGTRLAPRLLTWQWADSAVLAASGAMRSEVVSAQPQDARLVTPKAVNLSIAAGRGTEYGGSSLVVERGADILLAAGGTLSLSATRDLTVGVSGGEAGDTSTLSAPGGNLTLGIVGVRGSATAAEDKPGFVANQALWLGDGARLSVAGTALLRTESGSSHVDTATGSGQGSLDAERLTGTVLGGGAITLNAQRGYVVAAAGAQLNLDGASARLNLPGLTDAVTVAKSAGTLTVSSPEGFVLDAQISARAPADAHGQALADGGRLSLAVARAGNETGTDGTPYLDNPSGSSPALVRQLLIGSAGGELLRSGARHGDDLNAALGNGIGYVSQALLTGAGFAGLTLAAGDRLQFASNLNLSMPLGLTLDAPALAAAPGVQVMLSASTAQVGDSSDSRKGSGTVDRGALAASASTPAATLTISAPSIDLVGTWGLQGWGHTLLDAGGAPSGQIRLSNAMVGETLSSLSFAGTLGLVAGQVYATSGDAYRVAGLAATGSDDTGSTLTISTGAGGAASVAPLSAFGAFSGSATQIVQAGVLWQPFGQISLSAERGLSLTDGSLTSVSGEGLTLPYGSTRNVAEWVLPDGANASSLPRTKGISLSGSSIDTASGARVSASGGGTVKAWEFFAGVGGSTDYFETAGLYAVLPNYNGTQALALAGGLLPAGSTREIVITTAGSGLAPGRYTMLPARYALLAGSLPQGAYLVHRAADQGKAALTTAIAQDDGSTVVAGYLSAPGSVAVGTPGERFVVEPASTFLARSEIRLTDINALLASRANTLGSATPALPRDGGQVQVSITGSQGGVWQAALALQGQGGAAGTLDLSATQLALMADAAAIEPGSFGVTAALLAGSGAGSVLLGGVRSAIVGETGAWRLDTSATRSVSVDLGKQSLQLEELLIGARDGIRLATGTQLSASSTATLGERTLRSTGDGALLALSANALTLERSGQTLAAGTVSIGEGSRLSGHRIGLDATTSLQLPESATLSGQAVSLAAPRLVLGSAGAADLGSDASEIRGAVLQSLQSTADLELRAYRSLDLAGSQDWARRDTEGRAGVVAQRLVLDAPLLRGLANEQGQTAQVDIAAQTLLLRNSSGIATDTAGLSAAEGSMLRLQAVPALRYGVTGGLTLDSGSLVLGFATSQLRSTGDIVLAGSGSHRALGDLSLQAARVTATTGAQQSITADGTLRIAADSAARSLGELVGAGAVVNLTGRTVQQDGVIDLPGGTLNISALGNAEGQAADEALRFGAGSLTSVAGFSRLGSNGAQADGLAGQLNASAAKGWISLLGTVDASAALRSDGSRGEGDAGSVSLSASGEAGELRVSQDGSSGRLLAVAGKAANDLGGRLSVDVQRMAAADALAALGLAGGFSSEWALRVRSGDVSLGNEVRAQRIALAADSGNLRVDGATLDARAAAGGEVQLAAGQSLNLGEATSILASSSRVGANGGDVLLSAGTGRLSVAAGALVDAGGDEATDGRIVLRAARSGTTAATASVAIDALNTRQLRAGEVDVEAVRTYTGVSTLAAGNGTGATLGQTTINNDNTAFMAGQSRVLAALGVDADEAGRVNLRAGTEVRSTGNLTLAADWQLNNARPGGDAGFLTLRAAGDLVLNGSLSDGFSNAVGSGTSAGVLNDNTRSWSMRLVAGADLGAANLLRVRDLAGDGATSGSLTLAANKLVRTGAGSLQLAAGRDIVFGSGAQAYVAGRKAGDSATVLAELFSGQSAKPVLTEQGGGLSLTAGRDIVAAEATQLVNNWLWRSGILNAEGSAYASSSQLAWWAQFNRFAQSLGSFGGGNVQVKAGRDISNLQVMAPTQGYADARTVADADLQVRNGGDINVRAGRHLLGGQYLLGRGQGRLMAGGSISSLPANARADSAVLVTLDGQWTVSARDSIAVNTAFDPTAATTSAADGRSSISPYFYTWGADAAQRLNATAGSVTLTGELEGSVLGAYGLFTGSLTQPALLNQVMPATLHITAALGDVDFSSAAKQRQAMLFPAAQGALSVWAGGQIGLGWNLAMADSDPAQWPTFDNPVSSSGFSRLIGPGSNGLVPGTLAGVLAGTALHASDAGRAEVHAEGAIMGSVVGALRVPVAAEVSAGNDILALRLYAQNQRSDDTTRVTAGRNLLAGTTGEISVAGPGQLLVQAGRVIDLESSAGITSTGNLGNTTLSSAGASVTVQAARTGTLDLAAFSAGYLSDDGLAGATRAAGYRALLLQAVRQALGQPTLDYAQAWTLFQSFPAAVQAAFGQQVLAREFSAVYLLGTVPDSAAITTQLDQAFAARKAAVLAAGEAALAAGQALTLPGRSALQGEALRSYLAQLAALSADRLDLGDAVALRQSALQRARDGWRSRVAQALGSTVAALEAAAAADPASTMALAWQQGLADTSSQRFQDWRAEVLRGELRSAGAAASLYGVNSLPMRLALFDQGFRAAELAGLGSFVAHDLWPGSTPVLAYSGSLDLTQSGIVTRRGGSISLLNAGGAINVGLKDDASSANALGVMTLGGGNILAVARDDVQVNNQRIFVVGQGDLDIWSSNGDIDSGRGANTAVAAPRPVARRSVDGVVFETPATTTGAGLGILAAADGTLDGGIALYPAFGEIRALDAYIRAPRITVGSTIRGADNLKSPAAIGGAAVVVSAPAPSVTTPPPPAARTVDNTEASGSEAARQRNALLTVDLLGIGPAEDEACTDEARRAGRCK